MPPHNKKSVTLGVPTDLPEKVSGNQPKPTTKRAHPAPKQQQQQQPSMPKAPKVPDKCVPETQDKPDNPMKQAKNAVDLTKEPTKVSWKEHIKELEEQLAKKGFDEVKVQLDKVKKKVPIIQDNSLMIPKPPGQAGCKTQIKDSKVIVRAPAHCLVKRHE
ncbi:hypothetical protein DACRYDRAFT_108934 [Dacryopinax primogenitus]|uniref:Uncharacterized protein n=1 Tax=Dacryopinax primogenitus (strain DJM 731) TaxID=1858805 RepID=M5FV92_DACPD|nr:uncharacterized protein DACRYDRAFT_108934 [Dacryopinax primogenitus]EJU00184.1 hypothetical protein DACRYDRAFT_108934 [Dacryopinax primogenitus]